MDQPGMKKGTLIDLVNLVWVSTTGVFLLRPSWLLWAANSAGGCLSHCRLKAPHSLCFIIVITTSYHVCYHGYSYDTPAIYQLLQSIGSGYWQAKNILPGNLECLVVQTCHSPMSENDRGYV